MKSEKGFTLIELLVAIAIAMVVLAGIYKVYMSQQQSYIIQEQMAAMQQNLRAAMFFMAREIRMAGCDPTGTAGSSAGIQTANATTISFTEDIRGKNSTDPPDGDVGDPNENITYSLFDYGGDGDNDLGRNTGGGNMLLAENIDAIDFVYLDGNQPPNVLNPNRTNVPGASIGNIRAVQITIVARSDQPIRGYTDTNNYQNQQGVTILAAPNDSFRRSIMTTTVKCRNLGLGS